MWRRTTAFPTSAPGRRSFVSKLAWIPDGDSAKSLFREVDIKCGRCHAGLFPFRKREGDLDLARSDFLFDTHGVVQSAASTSLFDRQVHFDRRLPGIGVRKFESR